MVGRKTGELLRWDREHVIHPAYMVGQNLGIIIEKTNGVILQDTEGKEYLDGASQLTCVKRKKLAMAAVVLITPHKY